MLEVVAGSDQFISNAISNAFLRPETHTMIPSIYSLRNTQYSWAKVDDEITFVNRLIEADYTDTHIL